MLVRRRFLVRSAAALAAVLVKLALAATQREVLPLGAAINKAGRQRMLSQRMAKAWLMIGQNVAAERGQKILAQSIALFESQLEELKGLAPNDEIRSALAALEQEWPPYKTLLQGTPTADNAKRIYAAGDTVLGAAHRLTLAYEKLAQTPAGHLVNVAGRQRMLSQRMAKLHLFRTWGVNSQQAQQELVKARGEFVAALQELNAAPQNTPQIKAELALVDQQWLFFDDALNAARDAVEAKRGAQDVATTSERILEVMEGVVPLYEKLAQ